MKKIIFLNIFFSFPYHFSVPNVALKSNSIYLNSYFFPLTIEGIVRVGGKKKKKKRKRKICCYFSLCLILGK